MGKATRRGGTTDRAGIMNGAAGRASSVETTAAPAQRPNQRDSTPRF